jgi:non-lysosomal glucosylceramidase
MDSKGSLPRRDFLKQAAGAVGAVTQLGGWPGSAELESQATLAEGGKGKSLAGGAEVGTYPVTYEGNHLKMLAFPLGGVGAGSLSLGGRGQLRDWEIFNRPNVGFSPSYAMPTLWVKSGNAEPQAHVLEARILPPYEGSSGLGSNNSPGLSRLATAKFRGEYPLAHIDFEDKRLPVSVQLDAFSPFIPHNPDDSGLPAAILRYRVVNAGHTSATVAIAFSIDNPVMASGSPDASRESRVNELEGSGSLQGLLMSNPGLATDDPMQGSFALAAIPASGIEVTRWRGWPQGPWWNSPLLFWDFFSKQGQLSVEPEKRNQVGALCLRKTIEAVSSAEFTFVLAWHFPNRTPDWCGWDAPKGKGKTVIGNFYSVRFKNAWDAAEYTAKNLESLEARTRLFAKTLRESTIPAVVKEAASANLSTLASTTCFRTADGEFHGFEGANDDKGCCFGNCTHVWNYETATNFLFPSLALSLRRAAFGYSQDEQGGIRTRQLLPDGLSRFDYVAADGQMGQIMHAYLDWKLSGDMAWLREMWPRIRKAIQFAWETGGWDPNRKGVMEGVQHNTYDVEFYGPNPMCGIYYLGALRACEEMARALGNTAESELYKDLFVKGSAWTNANLFNGEFFVQEVRGFPIDQIAPHLRSNMGSQNTMQPQYQVGKGCLIDQMVGQYLAEVAGLGLLIDREKIAKTLNSIYRYNYKRTLIDHDNVERTFALNDEAAMVICDYGKAERPEIPFPYFAEVMTGFEHSTAALMLYSGMVNEGVECIHNIRSRYDGAKRNPWDEAECGHHYARAMASWSSFVALSGFDYTALSGAVIAVPRIAHGEFHCFWSTATGWGTFTYQPAPAAARFELKVLEGVLACKSCEITINGNNVSAKANGRIVGSSSAKGQRGTVVHLNEAVKLNKGEALVIVPVA